MGVCSRVISSVRRLPHAPWARRRAGRGAASASQGTPTTRLDTTCAPSVATGEPPLSGTAQAADRDRLADLSDRAADLQDVEAGDRDRRAGFRDRRSQARAPASASSEALAAAIDRHHAQRDRRKSAEDRGRAAQDRINAGTARSVAAAALARSAHDQLTGLYRRDAGMVELEREIAHATRIGQSYVLAYIDVDGLRARNNSRGHAAGDHLLVQVAEAVVASLRPYDVSVRVGGDEMVCGLADIGLAGAAERFHRLGVELSASDAPISVGLAERQPGESFQALLARADTDMYEQRRTAVPARATGDL